MRSLLFQKLVKAISSHDFPGFRGLLDAFNYYDKSRVKQVGADRAAAEWVVRCEGKVRFDTVDIEFNDYNTLIKETSKLDPSKEKDLVHVVSIDATDASITGYGCRHFSGLDFLKDVRFVRCKKLTDIGIFYMKNAVKDNLISLEIGSCPRITEDGLKHICSFAKLRSLILHDLSGVSDKGAILKLLKKHLPLCAVHYLEAERNGK